MAAAGPCNPGLLLPVAAPVGAAACCCCRRPRRSGHAGLDRHCRGPDAGDAVTPEQRAELQRDPGQNAAVLEAQAAVVKAVAKLIGPTVVHIEADGATRETASSTATADNEEAGSGVIIQWKDKHYVLTNRHVVHAASTEGIKINLADGRPTPPRAGLGRRRHRRGRAGRRGAPIWWPPRWATATAWKSATSCWPWAVPSA